MMVQVLTEDIQNTPIRQASQPFEDLGQLAELFELAGSLWFRSLLQCRSQLYTRKVDCQLHKLQKLFLRMRNYNLLQRQQRIQQRKSSHSNLNEVSIGRGANMVCLHSRPYSVPKYVNPAQSVAQVSSVMVSYAVAFEPRALELVPSVWQP